MRNIFYKNKRIFSSALVLLFPLSFMYYSSFYRVLFGYQKTSMPGSESFSLGFSIFYELLCLAFLIFVLFDRNENLSNLGLKFEKKDIFHSLLLAFFAVLVWAIYYYLFNHFYYLATQSYYSEIPDGLKHLRGYLIKSSVFLVIVFTLVNPVFEELTMRAFFIREFNFFTEKKILSIFLSSLFQAGYHFYQGGVQSVGYFFTFLLFSIYYQQTRRITPIVAVHFSVDAFAHWKLLFAH